MTVASSPNGDGQFSAAIRINGELHSIPTNLPPDAVFPIYSITKTLTAICVLRLVETGSLRLSDTACQWLPEVTIPAAVTLTHLLRHTSGLRDYGPLRGITTRFGRIQINHGRGNSFSMPCCLKACSARAAKGFPIPTSDICC